MGASKTDRRLLREKQTVAAMINLYCRKNHRQVLCNECIELITYAKSVLIVACLQMISLFVLVV